MIKTIVKGVTIMCQATSPITQSQSFEFPVSRVQEQQNSLRDPTQTTQTRYV